MGLLISFIAVIASLITPGAADAQASSVQRNQQGPVTVTASLAGPAVVGSPLRVSIKLDTHSVDLDGVAFEEALRLLAADGKEAAPVTLEQTKGSGHHRETVAVFGAPAAPGRVRVVVRGVGGVAERVFEWDVVAAR